MSAWGGVGRLSARPALCSALRPPGDGDFLVLSLERSELSGPLRSLERLRPPRPFSFPLASLLLLAAFSAFGSLAAFSFSLERLRLWRLEADFPASVDSRRDFPLLPARGDPGGLPAR